MDPQRPRAGSAHSGGCTGLQVGQRNSLLAAGQWWGSPVGETRCVDTELGRCGPVGLQPRSPSPARGAAPGARASSLKADPCRISTFGHRVLKPLIPGGRDPRACCSQDSPGAPGPPHTRGSGCLCCRSCGRSCALRPSPSPLDACHQLTCDPQAFSLGLVSASARWGFWGPGPTLPGPVLVGFQVPMEGPEAAAGGFLQVFPSQHPIYSF